MTVALRSAPTRYSPLSVPPMQGPATWMPTFEAELTVRYADRDVEHHSLRLLPRQARGQVTILHRDGQGGELEHTRMHAVNTMTPMELQVAQMLATFFFGANGLLPRILGTPEWASAALNVHPASAGAGGIGGMDDAGDENTPAIRLELHPIASPSPRGVMTCRQVKAGVTSTMTIYQRPADADPIYALLRVALGLEITRVPG